jgi:hypothetical protein
VRFSRFILLGENLDAKVILTKCDPEKWYESCKNTIFRVSPDELGNGFCVGRYFGELNRRMWQLAFQSDFSKEGCIHYFSRFNEDAT